MRPFLKTLYLLRHAEADSARNDLERDLSVMGRSHAESLGRWMSKKGIMPDQVFSSPAKRAKMTAEICSEKVGYQATILFEDSLYNTYENTFAVQNDLNQSH